MYVYIITIIMSYIVKIFVFIGCIFISPIFLFSLFLIWLEDGKPVIFVQTRLGISKKEFDLYKIRTMLKTTPNLATHEVTISNHLKYGSILRRLKIDELPQIYNYLKGDLSLVGPRPGLPNQKELKLYREKHHIFLIKPGITGLSQVLGYDMSNPKLLAEIDEIYIKNKTFKLDILIFLATFIKYFKLKLEKKFKNDIRKLEI
jgi:O-antigen biosynthesis protein WbqP